MLSTMPRKPKGAPSRQEIILEVAKDLFYERGFAAVGVDEIGQRAGVTGPAIYRHFKGKDEILSTLFDDAVDRLIETTVVADDGDPWELLESLARKHVMFVLSERKLAGVRVREERSLSASARRSLHRRERRYYLRWVELLKRVYPDRSDAELTTLTHIVLGAVNATTTWPDDALKGEHVPGLIVGVLLHGLHAFDGAVVQHIAA
jgi:AcrR family transcriptional regulator